MTESQAQHLKMDLAEAQARCNDRTEFIRYALTLVSPLVTSPEGRRVVEDLYRRWGELQGKAYND